MSKKRKNSHLLSEHPCWDSNKKVFYEDCPFRKEAIKIVNNLSINNGIRRHCIEEARYSYVILIYDFKKDLMELNKNSEKNKAEIFLIVNIIDRLEELLEKLTASRKPANLPS